MGLTISGLKYIRLEGRTCREEVCQAELWSIIAESLSLCVGRGAQPVRGRHVRGGGGPGLAHRDEGQLAIIFIRQKMLTFKACKAISFMPVKKKYVLLFFSFGSNSAPEKKTFHISGCVKYLLVPDLNIIWCYIFYFIRDDNYLFWHPIIFYRFVYILQSQKLPSQK